jgi:hypothetical protein
VATGDAGIVFIQPAVGNTIQKASTGTHANFASLYVPPFSVGAGASTLTNASSIYVPSAPSGATNNYAISVGSGTSSFNGLVDISGASGGQIKFPATQNASADANTLDDYEEGSWTPSVGGTATYSAREGNYVKIGRLVYIRCSMTINVIGTGSTTTLSGLPFTCFTTAAGTGGHISVGIFLDLASNSIFLAGYVGSNTTDIIFTNSTVSAASMTNSPAIFGNSARVDFTLMYQV